MWRTVLALALVFSPCFLTVLAGQPLEIVRLLYDDGEVVQVTNGLVRYQFAELGGSLRSAYVHFTSYRTQNMDAVPGWEGGVQPSLGPGVSLPFEVWLGEATADPTVYALAVEPLAPDVAVVRLQRSGDGLVVDKAFTINWDAFYTMDVDVRVQAPGQKVRLVLGHRPSGRDVPDLRFLYDGKVYTAPLAPGTYTKFEGVGLVGKEMVYFLRVEEGAGTPFLGQNAAGQPVFGLEAIGELAIRGTLYSGRNRYLLLQRSGLEVLTPLGFFSRFLVWVMQFFEWLYRITGNYGWAIILFTLFTRIVVYPLMRNQYRSMAKMQRLAPKLKKLQERYKDDRQALQQQMMELYRQEGVNPLGGCLPMLLQFPILILLWQTIMYSAEQIHLSPGFLWIRDLSQPDPYYILLILATGAQLLQQWFTQRRLPEPPTGGSQVLGWVFPLVMALLFMSFPAGLWLYWLLTTLLQIGQQWIFDWEMAREARVPTATVDDGSQDQ